MTRDDCPSTQALQSLIDAGFWESDAAQLVAHIDHCDACQTRFEELERQARIRSDCTAAQPSAFVRRLRRFVRGETLVPIQFPGDDVEMPEFLGEYRIDEELGRGGMGVVYKAWDTKLLRTVAIKRMRLGLAQMPDIRHRILNEARAVAQLNHPNIVSLFSVQDDASPPYFSMEYIDGETLQELFEREKQLAIAAAIRVGLQIATALTVAHSAGVIHCDLKPANVLLTHDGRDVRITDFGIALAQLHQHREEDTKYLGTPHYMSPEQFRAEPVDQRSDLFGLGILLFRALTGRLPFEATSVRELRHIVCECEPPNVACLRPSAPGWLCDLTHQLLQKNACQRPQTANEVVAILTSHAQAEVETSSLGGIKRSLTATNLFWFCMSVAAISVLTTLFNVTGSSSYIDVEKRSPQKSSNAAEPATHTQGLLSKPSLTDIFTSTQWTWTTPEPLGVDVIGKFTTPFISHDGLTFLFGDGDDTTGKLVQHLMIATRPSLDLPWHSAVPLRGLNDPNYSDLSPTVTADGLIMVFASAREGGFGDFDLWISTRDSLGSLWQEPTNLGSQFNTVARESHPSISPNGLSLAFVPYAISEHGSFDISISTRPNRSAPWSAPQVLPDTVNSVEQDRFPQFITDDAMSLVRIDRTGHRQICISERVPGSNEWTQARSIAPIPGIVFADGCICADGTTLIFQNDPLRSRNFEASFAVVKRVKIVD
ncbi:MAG: serine/threonine protein kinase [Planctomycetales bacterium]|nr:serine/threonine protein kinase [Planctomycetales bacterium]